MLLFGRWTGLQESGSKAKIRLCAPCRYTLFPDILLNSVSILFYHLLYSKEKACLIIFMYLFCNEIYMIFVTVCHPAALHAVQSIALF